MNTFRSIDELVRILDREKLLLKEMFGKRHSTFRYDYALELAEYKEERIRYLIEHGVIRDSGDMVEMEDLYLNFFEEVLQVNEEINVAFVKDHLDRLNENIDYYLSENNEKRRYGYHREVMRCLKNIALTTMRNVMDLKRNIDNTYKNEPTYKIKIAKLKNLDEKRRNISTLITQCELVIDQRQATFFRVAMDVQMRSTVSDVRLQLNDSYHNLIEIEKQIIHYLNIIAYQNRIFEKARRLKYLRDQILLDQYTDLRQAVAALNPVWMEPQPSYRTRLSIDELRTSDVALELIRKVASRQKGRPGKVKNIAQPIPDEYLLTATQPVDTVRLNEVFNAFAASGTDLFRFVMQYDYHRPTTGGDRLLYFCQIASQYTDQLDITDQYASTAEVEYPLIYAL